MSWCDCDEQVKEAKTPQVIDVQQEVDELIREGITMQDSINVRVLH